MKGQLSAEMLIVLVIVLGLAVLLATTLMKTAKDTGGKVEQKAESISNICTTDSECTAIGMGSCDTATNRCV